MSKGSGQLQVEGLTLVEVAEMLSGRRPPVHGLRSYAGPRDRAALTVALATCNVTSGTKVKRTVAGSVSTSPCSPWG